MSRVKRGIVTKKRHKRLLKQTKGYWGQRKNVLQRARETLMRAMVFAYKGRKMKKRDMRSLFIMRIKAGAQLNGTKYNVLIHGLKKADVRLNRKMLSQIALYDPDVFKAIVTMAQEQANS